jgi:hypothetical protein
MISKKVEKAKTIESRSDNRASGIAKAASSIGSIVGTIGGAAIGAATGGISMAGDMISLAREQHLAKTQANMVSDQVRGNLGAGDFVDIEALKVAADVLRKAIEGNPVIPGHDDQYNIAEMSYNNGYAKGCEDSKPKWIPVSERLPEKGQSGVFPDDSINVLVYREYYDEIRVGHYDYHWNEFYTVDDLLMGHVTHWMPLPNPPKEVDK